MESEKTRVLHLTSTAGKGGGADTVILSTLALLDPERFYATAAYLRHPEQDLGPVAERFRSRGVPFAEFAGRKVFDVTQFAGVSRALDDSGIDILHCHGRKADVFGALLKIRHRKMKTVSTLHGWVGNTRKGRFYGRLDRLVLRTFDLVIAVSGSTMEIARAHGIKDVQVIANGVDPDFWTPVTSRRRTRDRFVVGFAGRLSKEKGILEFIAAAGKLAGTREGYEFQVVGGGPEEPAARSAAAALEKSGSLRFLGHLEKEALRDWYRGLDVLLISSWSEGLPLVALEASAVAVPVVSTRVGGVEELITHGDNGLLAEAGEVEHLAALVRRLRRDPMESGRIARRARETVVDRFSLQEGVRRLETLYDTLHPPVGHPRRSP